MSYRPEETGGRQREKSLDTRHRRLDDRYRVLPWPEHCTVVVCLPDALFRFSLSSDSHRILIWRERGSRNHPSNIIERNRYGGRGVLVWGGIMLGSRTDLHIFDAGSVNGTRYCNEILPCVRLFRGAMGLQFLFMDDNAPCHRTVAAEQLLESRRLAARTLPPVTIRELRLALQDEWAAIPQQLIDTLILSMSRRCETCKAVLGVLVQIVKSDKNCTSGITPFGFMMEMEPQCNEDGRYLFMQCFKDSKFCACFSKRGFPITPPLSILKSCKCLVKKHRKESSGMIGGFIPQCEKDGTFKKEQCHYSTGYCYCADPYTGKNTTVPSRGDPNCD
ncbi:transposable element Tcb1 transposase [Trichonephila clavipes]|nr:transposable element Tcb1 transposase [Trichonephila clavipes]